MHACMYSIVDVLHQCSRAAEIAIAILTIIEINGIV